MRNFLIDGINQKKKLLNPRHRPLFSKAGKRAKIHPIFDQFSSPQHKTKTTLKKVKFQSLILTHSQNNISQESDEFKNIEELSYNSKSIFKKISGIQRQKTPEEIQKFYSLDKAKNKKLKMPQIQKKKEKRLRLTSIDRGTIENSFKRPERSRLWKLSQSLTPKLLTNHSTLDSLGKGKQRTKDKFKTLSQIAAKNKRMFTYNRRILNRSENFLKKSLKSELFDDFEKYKVKKIAENKISFNPYVSRK
jgi:hypothetical protein